MYKIINDIIVFINQLESLQKICLLAIFAILSTWGVYLSIKANYNAKKIGIKIGSIIFTVIMIALTVFIITCF